MQPDKVLDSIQYRNGTQPQVITWACRKDVELCCGTDCCPADDDAGLSNVGMCIGIIAAIALAVCCCGVLWYMICNGKGGFDGQQPGHVARYDSPYQQDDYFYQYGPPALYHPDAYAYQGYPPQVYGPEGYSPYGNPPHYYPSEGYPSPGYPPEGYPPEGYYPPGNSPPEHLLRKHQQPRSQKSDQIMEQQKGEASKGLESKKEQKSKESVPSSKRMEPKSKE
ncbi:hypothetical protein COOONC_00397 [Cooperia oncophora]